ncbi:hypothetical protein OIE69_00565 [Actinacidiphila glaucinigra]|uniref:hypothetical protein n=1 Tax=Actinacidiphila glaucinigra TaxID=235986 RepID=UPI002DDC77CE|nr:hypothetical protein [Actinacidiphila glaucinigra]WSD57547.1 hypothetical protein OIE69_00565 [Actinacidiphila glaucinigra]
MAIVDVVLASHRSGDMLRTAARTLVVAVSPACRWVLRPRRAAGHTRNLLADLGDHAADFRYLLRDRDSRYTHAFDAIFTADGIEILKTAP